ncbi:MAG: tryptophan--tRNA ligase [Bdellovibrio sp.]|nr:tryptophan--tRNA ligase [Bdellovibrio sp.]
MKPIILTGDRPTGPLHIGHYVGSLKNRFDFQDTYKQYLLIADSQAMTDNFERPELVHENVTQVALDYLAVGLDPKKSTFFIQSQIPELCEMMFYFMNLVTVARVQRNPTIKEEIKQKSLEESLPVGFFCYPISQAADILAFDADVVPVGEDQNPMIEQTNEIARKFNLVYKVKCFKDVKSIVGKIGRLPGTDGKAKMSKSLGNAIMLGDTADQIKKKVNAMFTDPNHLRIEDPGSVEGNVVFMFLDYFDPDKAGLEELKAHYRRGGLGDGQIKKRLIEIMDALIAPMRERRLQYAVDLGYVKQVLTDGTQEARQVAAKKMDQMKHAMKLIY